MNQTSGEFGNSVPDALMVMQQQASYASVLPYFYLENLMLHARGLRRSRDTYPTPPSSKGSYDETLTVTEHFAKAVASKAVS